MMKNVSILFATLIVAIAAPANAQQASTGVGVGSDFWTGSMKPELFQLHENGGAAACTGSEVFVTVRGTLGFCMDANENAAGAVEWEDAREICAGAGKRLPEPAEFKFACQAAVPGLSNMTNNWEYVSNFWGTFRNPYTPYGMFISVPVLGNTSCLAGRMMHIAQDPSPSTATNNFRCVR